MPLLDLKTDLKSLKYGKDRPGGGDSGQPYQKVDINTIDSGFNRLRMTKFDDGLIRGGIIGAANASIVDTLRIGKFLTDLPKGPLWIIKQVGLQLSNPKLETRKFPSGPGILGTLGAIANLVQDKIGIGPTRIYNLGINTLAQVPVNALGIHFDRHGLLPVQDENTKYLAVVQNNNLGTQYRGAGLPSSSSNRLVNYAIKLLPQQPAPRINNLLQSILSRIPIVSSFIKPQQQIIDSYVGGPGSVYGIGKTTIRRYDYTSNGTNKQQPQEKGKVNYINTLGVSQQYFSTTPLPFRAGGLLGALTRAASFISAKPNIEESNNLSFDNPTNAPTNLDQATYSNVKRKVSYSSRPNGTLNTPIIGTDTVVSVKNASYQKYKQIIDSKQLSQNINYVDGVQANQFGIYGNINNKETLGKTLLPNLLAFPTYTNGNTVIKLNKSWNTITRENRIGSGREDRINLTPLFEASSGTIGDFVKINSVSHKINDLVKFRIQSVDTDSPQKSTWMIFRAYVTQFSDNVDASWNPIRYTGRGEDFYIYNGFSRKINIGFKVAALSEREMKPMYQKLNYLMGNLMPDYDGNVMRGPLVRMTVGNWIDGQAGVLNSLSYNVPQDSPWEIGLKTTDNGIEPLILPHVIEVQMTFTPIGSQTKKENKISEKNHLTSHIAQNINDNPQYIEGDENIPTGLPIPGALADILASGVDDALRERLNPFFTPR